jgi:peroxiredoxin Q/BCP
MRFLHWLGLTKPRPPLDIGEAVPELSARDADGMPVSLGGACRDGFTLLYFFPKAGTPGCTSQACGLRDDFSSLEARGVRIIGISADSVATQRRFTDKNQLPFTLLSDRDHTLAAAFGVGLLAGFPMRQSFLIKNGRVVWRDLGASTRTHAREVLEAVTSLSNQNGFSR